MSRSNASELRTASTGVACGKSATKLTGAADMRPSVPDDVMVEIVLSKHIDLSSLSAIRVNGIDIDMSNVNIVTLDVNHLFVNDGTHPILTKAI